MVEKEDLGLGLSLSLKFPGAVGAVDHLSNSSSLHFNLPFNQVPDNWTNSFTTTSSSEAWHANSNYGGLRFEFDTRKSFLKGMGMAAAAAEGMAVLSPNSSSTVVSSMSHEQDSRKKLRLSKEQSALLEESFKDHTTLNPKQKQALANKLGLRPRQVEVWFQNRRARTKLKQTEVECELMKRCCENLTEENRRLEKELQELKAFKLSPQFHMQRTPMCPSCDHMAPSSTTKLPFNPWP